MSAFAILVATAVALVPALRPPLQCRAVPAWHHRPALMQEVAEERVLVTIATLSPTYTLMVEGALTQRNRERVLSGDPVYKDVDDMVKSYQEYEGNDKGMSREDAEDAVLTYLQKKATLEEGTFEGDPQEILTFALLVALVGGIVFNLATNGLPPPV